MKQLNEGLAEAPFRVDMDQSQAPLKVNEGLALLCGI